MISVAETSVKKRHRTSTPVHVEHHTRYEVYEVKQSSANREPPELGQRALTRIVRSAKIESWQLFRSRSLSSFGISGLCSGCFDERKCCAAFSGHAPPINCYIELIATRRGSASTTIRCNHYARRRVTFPAHPTQRYYDASCSENTSNGQTMESI